MVIALGLLIVIAGLLLLAYGLSPTLRDQEKWPQIGMAVSALAFIACGIWYWNNRVFGEGRNVPGPTAGPPEMSSLKGGHPNLTPTRQAPVPGYSQMDVAS